MANELTPILADGASPERWRAIGVAAWVLVLGAFLACEGLGLSLGRGWPTLSRILRTATRTAPGRWVLFGVWLWVGWHLFVRGWHFFLRGSQPPGPKGVVAPRESVR